MNDFQREIYKTIDRLTEEKLRGLGFDKTKRGKVVSVNGTNCIVEIDGEDYSCKLRRGIYIEPNDIVFVKFPQDSSVDKYVDTILGGNETPENLVISAEEILQKLKTVDGHGSGLDADTLDGKHGSEYATKEDLNGIDVDINGETIVENINLSTAIIDDKNLSIDVNDAISKKHNHSNKGVLDAITQNKVDNWNTVSDKSNIGHKHTETDITDLDKYTKSETDIKLSTKADKVYVDNSLSNKVDKVAGKGLSTEDYTTDMKNKLIDIEDGAEKNKVNSVNSKIGDVVINKSDIGLGSVENKSSATIRGEITNTNITNALGYTPENSTNKGIANGYAPLDSNIKIPLSILPDIAKQQTYVVELVADRDSLTGLIMGEKCYVTGTGDSYIWDGTKWVTLAKADWENVNLQWTNIVGKPQSNIADIDDATAKRHIHSNKTIIDTITQTLIDRWNSAWTHISDSVKHITSSERTKWNTIDNKADTNYVNTELNKKVDKVTGKQLSTEDFTTVEKTKLSNIETGANKYILPSATTTKLGGIKVGANLSVTDDGTIHANDNPASFIVKQEVFVATEGQTVFNLTQGSYKPNTNTLSIYLYGGKQPNISITETSSTSFKINSPLKAGVVLIAEYFETINIHPYPHHSSEHLTDGYDPIPKATASSDGLMAKEDKEKLDGVEQGANKYTHPSTHPASMIVESATQRFVSDTEKANWNTVDNKSNIGHKHTEADITNLDKYTKSETDAKLNLKQNNLNYTPIKDGGSTPEFRTGLESARPTATGSGIVYFAIDTKKIWKDTAPGIWTQMGGQDLPIASKTILGGVKVGNNLVITDDGVLSALTGDEKSTFIIKQELFTATEGQTLFNLTKGYYQPNTNTISVHLYGGKQPNISFNEISTSAFEFTEPLKAGDVVLVEYIELSSATPYPIHGNDHLTGGYDPIPKATASSDGLMAKEDKAKLNTIEQGANKYIHPTSHPASMITESTTRRFVSDSEKTKWNNVDNKVDKVSGKGLSDENYTLAEKNKLAGIATGATKNDTDTNLKNRANHTGTQPSSTISDFTDTVRNTVLTGLSTATNAVITTTDTVLSALGKLQKQISDNLSTLTSHIGNKSNPHGTTKSHVGLGNVDNTSDLDKPISTAAQTVLNNKSDKGHIHDDRYYTETEIDNKLNEKIDNSGNTTISGTKTFSDTLKVTGVENFDDIYIKRTLGSGSNGITYANLSDEIKNGGYHRFWKISFPTGASFWGKIKITLYGGYSSFNASGSMAKEVNVNFNTGSIYSNVGSYTELSGYVEKDFRISEAIWNSETSQWEFWIYSHQLQGNNVPYILMECWAKSIRYIDYFNQITFNPNPEFLQDTTYSNVKGNAAGQTLTRSWRGLPTYQNPYGETIASISDLPTKLSQLTKDIDFDERYYTESEMNTKLNDKVNNSRVLTDVPAGAKFTDTTYSEITTAEIDAGTSSTLRTITGRRIKYVLDKVTTMISALTKSDIGLGSVDNKSSATIRGEITKANITSSLGYTPIKDGGSTPEFKSGLENARGSATNSGLVYLATDTQKIYKDTGAWTQMGGQDLSIASTTKLGGIKVGNNLSIAADGTLSAVDDDSKNTFIVKQELFTATEGQTLFNLTKGNYQPNTNTISVYLYGGKQPNISISEISTSSFKIIEPLEAGNVVLVEYIELSSATPYPIHGNDHLTGGYDPIPKATTTSDGLMAKEDKSKLDDIEAGANKYTHPSNHPYSILTGVPTKLSDFSKDINFDERYYTESETDTLLSDKTDKTYVDSELGKKQNSLGYTPVNKSGDSMTGQLGVESTVFPVINIARNTSGTGGNLYGGARLQRKTTNPTNGVGIGFYFQAPNSNKTMTHAGMFGGALGTIQAGSEKGEIVISPSYAGQDPYTRRDLIVRAISTSKAEAELNGKLKTDQTLASDTNDTVATKKYVDNGLDNKVNNSRVLTDVPSNAKFTDTTYSEITTAEIDAGTANTLRTITGRRIKYTLDKVQGWINSLTKSDVGLSNVDNTSDLNKPISSATQTALNSKVDNSRVLADVPINAKFTDTIYTHPSNHPASMITESAAKRFVSDTEKSSWSNKWDYNESTIKAVKVNNASNADTVNGKTVVENVPSGAKFTDTITSINGKTGAISKADIVALGIPAQDTIYTHPTSHPASMITESVTRRFVGDTEKNSWNSKAEISDIPTRVGQLQNDKNYVTHSDLGEAGLGDMTKGVYDTNNNGKVDIAEVAETVVGNEIQLGGRFKIAYNDIEDSLDIEVI